MAASVVRKKLIEVRDPPGGDQRRLEKAKGAEGISDGLA